MNDKENLSFPEIVKCLKELNGLLQCLSCKKQMNAPVSLWSCDHVFCEICIQSQASCPICELPCWTEDQIKNRRLENISKLANNLECYLSNVGSVSEVSFLSDKQIASAENNDAIGVSDASLNNEHGNVSLKKSRKVSTTISGRISKKKRMSNDDSKKSIKLKPKTTAKVPSQKNVRGETPLHIAAMLGSENLVEKLIEKNADVNSKDYAGWTPLHEACNKGHVGVVEKLLNAGALIDIPGYENDTPLIDAVNNDQMPVVKLLLEHGADVHLRNSDGKTALDLAQSADMKNTLSLHLSKNSDNTVHELLNITKPDSISIAFSSSIKTKNLKGFMKILHASLLQGTCFGCSHYIVPHCDSLKGERTLKYLQAMAIGAWVIHEKWIEKCIEADSWVNESSFLVKGSFEDTILDGPLRSMKAQLKCSPRIFEGCHFFLYGSFSSPLPSKLQLLELIKGAGGQILRREPKPDNDIVQSCRKVPYHACPDTPQFYFTYYIVYDPSQKYLPRLVSLGKVCSVSVSWILDCISQFMLCDIS